MSEPHCAKTPEELLEAEAEKTILAALRARPPHKNQRLSRIIMWAAENRLRTMTDLLPLLDRIPSLRAFDMLKYAQADPKGFRRDYESHLVRHQCRLWGPKPRKSGIKGKGREAEPVLGESDPALRHAKMIDSILAKRGVQASAATPPADQPGDEVQPDNGQLRSETPETFTS